jgi:putative ABC transport system permease protein
MPDESITFTGLAFAALLCIPLIIINHRLKIRINRQLMISVLRMAAQLAFAAVYLNFLFALDHVLVNIAYLLFMVMVSCATVLHTTHIKFRAMALPVFLALLIPHVCILLFFNTLVIRIDNILSAKYLITIGGMILGNCLKSAIMSIEAFLGQVQKLSAQYHYALLLGASKFQALSPFINDSMKKSLNPVLAGMASTGIVALPGMATGQILGGADPLTAVMYQTAILLAILAAQYFCSLLSILFVMRSAFDGWGLLRKNIFRQKHPAA